MPKVIKLEINELPPSINKLYTISSFRSITLTAAGRKFKNKIISEFTQKLLFHIGQLDPNKAHTLEFIFYMPEILNVVGFLITILLVFLGYFYTCIIHK